MNSTTKFHISKQPLTTETQPNSPRIHENHLNETASKPNLKTYDGLVVARVVAEVLLTTYTSKSGLRLAQTPAHPRL